MQHIVLIFVGGGFGAVCRHFVGLASLRLLGPGFPWGTFTVNIVGSFIMGAFIAWLVARGGSTSLRLFLATGFLGGFTTFSAFSLDFALLWERGQLAAAAAYAGASVLMSLGAVFAGLAIMRFLST